VKEVGVDREGRLAALVLGDRDLMLLGEADQRLAAAVFPLPPRRDHPDVGLQRIVTEFEADLVVALAGGAVADRICADLAGNLDLPLGDQGPGDRGAEQILPLIDRVGPEHREHIIAHELLAHVLDEDVLRLDAEQLRLARAGAMSSPWPRSAVKVTTSARYSVCSHLRMIEVSSPPE
jgi:hypothetical protein